MGKFVWQWHAASCMDMSSQETNVDWFFAAQSHHIKVFFSFLLRHALIKHIFHVRKQVLVGLIPPHQGQLFAEACSIQGIAEWLSTTICNQITSKCNNTLGEFSRGHKFSQNLTQKLHF